MKLKDFSIGDEFLCGNKRWRCTDIGSRVVVAICLEPHVVTRLKINGQKRVMQTEISDNSSWFNGPPYAVVEIVFDEYDMDDCSVAP